jgi:hypothetical protein
VVPNVGDGRDGLLRRRDRARGEPGSSVRARALRMSSSWVRWCAWSGASVLCKAQKLPREAAFLMVYRLAPAPRNISRLGKASTA